MRSLWSRRREGSSVRIAVVGGGPAGLMAAEAASQAGVQVDLYEAMPSVGRKFLVAGKGGLNLTHLEPLESFLARYGSRGPQIETWIKAFGPDAIRGWAEGLGVPTFIGSSGRVFPKDMKAAPLLRRWLTRLKKQAVRFHVRHRWAGWDGYGALRFSTPQGERTVQAGAVVLALGGGSWPHLGSDAAWVSLFHEKGVEITPLRSANCGFDIAWSVHMRDRFSGHPVKSVAVLVPDRVGDVQRRRGEFVITRTGVEGGVIYAVAASLRDRIEKDGKTILYIDLAPDRDLARLVQDLSRPKGKRSIAGHLQRCAGITGVKSALLHEVVSKQDFSDPRKLAAAIKSLPLTLTAPRPLAEAISTAGGVSFDELDERLMVRKFPGVFCAGEMLDWEAPTGGYLLTACFAGGRAAGIGAANFLRQRTT